MAPEKEFKEYEYKGYEFIMPEEIREAIKRTKDEAYDSFIEEMSKRHPSLVIKTTIMPSGPCDPKLVSLEEELKSVKEKLNNLGREEIRLQKAINKRIDVVNKSKCLFTGANPGEEDKYGHIWIKVERNSYLRYVCCNCGVDKALDPNHKDPDDPF